MNIISLFRDAWKITSRAWPLWTLAVGFLISIVPAVLLGGTLGGLSALLTLQTPTDSLFWIETLRQTPVWQLILLWSVALIITVFTSALTYICQAAMLRGATLAAEQGSVSLGAALALGWRRVRTILILSLTFGGIIAIFSLLPPLAVFITVNYDPQLGSVVLQGAQLFTGPVGTGLSLVLFLIILVVAVEDVRLRAAPGRAWTVFRQGWWALLVVFIVSALAGLPLMILLVPLIIIVPLGVMFGTTAGVLVTLVCCAGVAVVGIPYLLLTFVFTTVLYALTYQAAARLADATQPPVST